ncbi:MAG: ADP-dependent glucokinase/phosphofructokinase [Acetobacteraceae bacterium]
MRPIAEPDWRQAYVESAARLRRAAANSRLILCGGSACIDRLVTLEEAAPLLLASAEPAAILLGSELLRRARAGIGGEIVSRSAEALALPDHLGARSSLGGTAAQAAYALAQLGAPVLLALQDRTEAQIALLHPDILVATGKGLVRAGSLTPEPARGRPQHLIVEYVEGRGVAGIVPSRSTRVIVRFADDGMDHDRDFVTASEHLAAEAACGILSGFNAIPPGDLNATLAAAVALARSWRDVGIAALHVELGDFPNQSDRDAVLAALAGYFTSLGMNYHELEALLPADVPVVARVGTLARRLGAERVAVHADEWALTATRRDPCREQQALLAGCLLAASRAMHGRPHVPDAPPDGARFHLPYPALAEADGWYAVSCPAPWLPRPASTIGLGDTFVAGTMLVLGRACNEPATVPIEVATADCDRRQG